MQQQSTKELCEEYAAAAPSDTDDAPDAEQRAIKKELDRREAVSTNDWPMINRHHARLGISECALLASWGEPVDVKQTVTSGVESTEYLYGHCHSQFCKPREYAFLTNGHVIGLQY